MLRNMVRHHIWSIEYFVKINYANIHLLIILVSAQTNAIIDLFIKCLNFSMMKWARFASNIYIKLKQKAIRVFFLVATEHKYIFSHDWYKWTSVTQVIQLKSLYIQLNVSRTAPSEFRDFSLVTQNRDWLFLSIVQISILVPRQV